MSWRLIGFVIPLLFGLAVPLPAHSVEIPHAQPVILGEQSASAAACRQVNYPAGALQTPLSDRAVDRFITPPNPQGQTIVDLGLFIVSVTDIDPVNDTFTIEGFLDLVWCDPRLAFDPLDFGWYEKFFLEAQAYNVLTEIWYPDVTFPNQEHSRDTENLEIIIYDDGTVDYREKFSITLQARFELHRFPVDTQRLEVEIESLAWSEQYLVFHEEADMIGFSDTFEIPEWHVTGIESRLESVQEVRDREPFSEFVLSIDVQRQPGFYLWKVIVPVLVIMMLSWSVFLMSDNTLSERLGVSFTGILTVVAYQFIIADMLPRVPYLTLMDALLTLSFIAMALVIVENLLVHILKADHRLVAARRTDQLSRVLFPLVYTLSAVGLVLIFQA